MVHRNSWKRLLFGLLATSVLFLQAAPARAQAVDSIDASLKFVPENAAFYASMLRCQEQIQIIKNSKAWAKLMAIPSIKQAWDMAEAEWKNPTNPDMIRLVNWYGQKENQELVEMLADMGSKEIFIYGGTEWTQFVQLMGEVFGGARYGPLFEMLSKGGQQPADPQIQVKMALNALAANLDKIRMPELVVGFKLAKTKIAVDQVDRLEKMLNGLAPFLPPLKNVKKEKVGTAELLTLTLDGSMVPWELIPIKSMEEKPGQYDALIKKLTESKIAIGLGVRDGYLLFTLGESIDHVGRLGTGKSLATLAELRPLAKYSKERLTGISYVSKAFASSTGTSKKDLDDIVEGVSNALPADKLTEDQRKKIKKDLADLANDIKSYMTAPGHMLSFSFLTPRGVEGYTYTGGEHPRADASKPLTLLDHVGGSPIFAAVTRDKSDPQDYARVVKWLKAAHGYFEEYAVPQMDPKAKETYEKVMKVASPLLPRLDQTTAKMLIPATADSQGAFVIDGKAKSAKWHKEFPDTGKEMPMIEPAIIFGVRDADLLKKAAGEYRNIFNEFLKGIKEIATEPMPDIQIPEADAEKTKNGNLYFIKFPEEAGLDKQVVFAAGLSDKVCSLALTKAHAERLLASMPLKLDGGPLADTKKNLSAAVYFNPPGLFDLVTPWVEFGVKANAHNLPPNMTAEQIVEQVKTGIEVLKSLRLFTSVTYLEDGMLVSHNEFLIRDVE